MCDFFGIFAIIAWVFYNPHNAGEITLLGELWIWKSIWYWGLVFACGIIYGIWVFIHDVLIPFDCDYCDPGEAMRESCYWIITRGIWYFIGGLIGFALCGPLLLIIFEVLFFAPFAYMLYQIAHERYVGGFESLLVKKAFDFILDNKSMYTHQFANETQIKNGYNYNINENGNRNGNTNINTNEIIDNEIIGSGTRTPLDDDDDNRSGTEKNIISYVGLELIDKKLLNSKYERLFRLALINYCFVKLFKYRNDQCLHEYLELEMVNEWKNISTNSLRVKSSLRDQGNIWQGNLFCFVFWFLVFYFFGSGVGFYFLLFTF